MIRMEYPKVDLEKFPDREKVYALKRQVDTLTDNLQIVLDSIEEGGEYNSDNSGSSSGSPDINTIWNGIRPYVLKENAKIPIGQIDEGSTRTVMTATVPNITELVDGVCCYITNGVATSNTNWTLNVNGLGAKPVYSSMAEATRTTTVFNEAYTMLFVYNEHRIAGGCWDIYYGYDSNTNTIGYQIRTNSMALPVSAVTGRYRLLFTSPDHTHYVPPTTSTSTNATSSRTVNQQKIDPFGEIVYYGYTTVLQPETNVGTAYQWRQNVLALGYSFNRTGRALTLETHEPVYVKCTPQEDGSAIIDPSEPYVQTLPTAEDGKIYIYLGVAYSATNIELVLNHPVYCYRNGAIRQWEDVIDEVEFRDNLLNTLDLVPYGQNVYKEKGGVHLTYRDNIDTWFRLNLSSPLKAGNTYTLSFDCEGVPDGAEDNILYVVSDSTGSQTGLRNGRITTTFVMTADKTDFIMLDDNNTSSTRPSNTNIRLSNFLLEAGETASQYKPSIGQISSTVEELTADNVAYLSASEWEVGVVDGKFCNAGRVVSKSWNKDSARSAELTNGLCVSEKLYASYPMPMRSNPLNIATDRRGEYVSYINPAIMDGDGHIGATFRIVSPYANVTSGTTGCRYMLSGLRADVPTTPTVAEDATIGQAIVDIAKTYTHAIEQGRNFYYGRNLFYLNGDVVNDSQGRGMMECDTFAGLCLRGIPYENSPYASASSNIYANDEPNKTMTYAQLMSSTATNLPAWAVALRNKFVDATLMSLLTHEIRFASDDARLFWSLSGHLFSDINSVRKGDVAFWRTNGKPYFDGVTHVAIVGDNNDIYEVTGFERSNGRYLHNIKFENLVDHMPTYFARPYGFQ